MPLDVNPSTVRVLLVDDCPHQRTVVALHLRDPRICLEMADSGKAGVSAFKTSKFDVVLMDMEMPDMDGGTATRTIRHWELQERPLLTPIIAVTGHSDTETLARFFGAGCTSYLPKPLSRSMLLQAIAQYSPHHRGNPEQAESGNRELPLGRRS